MTAAAAPLREPAPAKVNLYLHVTGRRADGYHLLDSLVVFAGTGDTLTARADDEWGLQVTGPYAAALTGDADNLVLRAGRALAEAAGVAPRAMLVLDKGLPVASGIGGGSADAAAALRVLSRLWDVRLPGAALLELARGLGADVPVCLASQPRRMSGIGERLAPAPTLPAFGLALVNPGMGVATPDVFRARTGAYRPAPVLPQGWSDAVSLAADLAAYANDLEPAALGLCPAIGLALDALRATQGCLLARMSGSGGTCFGLFADPPAARAAAASLARPGWWAWGGAPHGTQDLAGGLAAVAGWIY